MSCVIMSLMLADGRETEPDWHLDIQDDVLEECNKYGNVVHIYVDKTSSEVSIMWKVMLIIDH